MKRLFILALLLLSLLASLSAQEVISSAGEHEENAFGSISWTIGEPIIATIPGADAQLTQGFHQPPADVPIPTMSQWAYFLYGLVIFTIGVVGAYNVNQLNSRIVE